MIDRFLNFIKKNRLLNEDDKILLAVSGGIDSMVMLDLFDKTHFELSVAHINHQLRGIESNLDEQLVRDTCERMDVPFHVKQIQISHKSNLQEKARKMRYEILQTIATSHSIDKIATAHHQDDQVETFFMNLARGSGLTGLSSIPRQNQNTIRPLLCFSKTEILAYAKANDIKFREDESNKSKKYTRNKIRVQLDENLSEIDSRFATGLKKSIQNLSDEHELMNHLIQKESEALIQKGSQGFRINKTDLSDMPGLQSFMFHTLKIYGFNRDQIIDICDKLDQTSKEFNSDQYYLRIERDHIIWKLKILASETEISISDFGTYLIDNHGSLNLSRVDDFGISSKNSEFIDDRMLSFPLKLRKWKDGDKFHPIGMELQTKKISKYLKDQKLSKAEKDRVLVLENSDGQIIWVIGMRLDERFKSDINSTQFVHLEWTA